MEANSSDYIWSFLLHHHRSFNLLALDGTPLMKCVWCGSKGGFANKLIIYPCSQGAVYECEWCSLKIEVSFMKEA
jgi:hypothetical protein